MKICNVCRAIFLEEPYTDGDCPYCIIGDLVDFYEFEKKLKEVQDQDDTEGKSELHRKILGDTPS